MKAEKRILEKPIQNGAKASLAFFAGALILLALTLRPPISKTTSRASEEGGGAAIQLSGEKALTFLESPGQGQSLMAVLTTARFGLKRQEPGVLDEKSEAGYLAMSHDQNLNAWFSDDGPLIRPTVPEAQRSEAWQIAFRLKAYGYGEQLKGAPPIVSHQVKGARIEYARSEDAVLAAPVVSPPLVEWYENRPEGIEQGFTLNERPGRRSYVTNEELRLVMSLQGDLRAEMKESGQVIELSARTGKRALSYSKLIAQDADGKELAARMEASADGREIALVVDDKGAAYPIVIDPIVASLEQKLEAGSGSVTARQTDARFGFALAIDGDLAVVGAWREDIIWNPSYIVPDVGGVYVFSRSGTSWSLTSRFDAGGNANDSCGWSVAIKGTRVAYGCPGANGQAGRAFFRTLGSGGATELSPPGGYRGAGDQFGYSIAIGTTEIVVGAPFSPERYTREANSGLAYIFDISSNSTPSFRDIVRGFQAGGRIGYSVAIQDNTLLVGSPNAKTSSLPYAYNAGQILDYERNSAGVWVFYTYLEAGDAAAGDSFGESVAISGNTAVVGAFGRDDNGIDAGAAYVFVRNSNGPWTQQQKLTASDGRAGDHFSEHAVAIDGDVIAVGAGEQDGFSSSPDPNRGEAYIFTRSGTVWTEQTSIRGEAAGDQFGISVDISGSTFIVGARAATASGITRAGAAYVYRLVPGLVVNVSTRLPVGQDPNALFEGFIVQGPPGSTKKIIVRALGPSLEPFGIPNFLANPTLEIFDANNVKVASNDNWKVTQVGGLITGDQVAEINASGLAPGRDAEAAIIANLTPGQYSAVVRGAGNTAGTGVVDAYDLSPASPAKLANVATRGFIRPDPDHLIGGFIVQNGSVKVVVAALGPSLTPFGVTNALSDTTLQLRDQNGAIVRENDDWETDQKAELEATKLQPSHRLEAALVQTLQPGQYSAHVRGKGGASGTGVVQIFFP